VAYALSDDMKIIDLGWPWGSLTTSTVGYPGDSWASCIICNARSLPWLGWVSSSPRG